MCCFFPTIVTALHIRSLGSSLDLISYICNLLIKNKKQLMLPTEGSSGLSRSVHRSWQGRCSPGVPLPVPLAGGLLVGSPLASPSRPLLDKSHLAWSSIKWCGHKTGYWSPSLFRLVVEMPSMVPLWEDFSVSKVLQLRSGSSSVTDFYKCCKTGLPHAVVLLIERKEMCSRGV